MRDSVFLTTVTTGFYGIGNACVFINFIKQYWP